MPLAEGTILENRYRIRGVLGEGGMSRVYLADDLRLKIQVALKENLQTSAESHRQFTQEAEMLARLAHPNLPRVIDFFTSHESGKQYFVMDYIAGEDLDKLVKRVGPLNESTALNWIRQILGALEYLHSQTPPIIHRDVKPSNIKITPDGKAVLVDFGIAKIYDARGGTMTGARAVTPGYAAPEQYGLRTDARSDIYSLGATLYTMLTGRVPPEAPLRMSDAEKLIAPRELNRTLSPNLESVLLRAMELSTTKRLQSVSHLRTALEGRATVSTPEGEGKTVFVPRRETTQGSGQKYLLWLIPISAATVLLIGIGTLVVNSGARQASSTRVPATNAAIVKLNPTNTVTAESTKTSAPTRTPTLLPTSTVTPSVTPTLTASPTASQTPSVTPTRPTIEVPLEYTRDLDRWDITYFWPESIDLSETPPHSNWIESRRRGIQRLYGELVFAGSKVGVILDVLDDVESQITFAFEGDTDFSDNPSYKTVQGSLPNPIEFQIHYRAATNQKYAIHVYYPIDFAREINAYRLHYYRASIRQGILKLDDIQYPIAIQDKNTDGSYADLPTTILLIDLNQDGRISDRERISANASFPIKGTYYSVIRVSESGELIDFAPANRGEVFGKVLDDESGAPIAGAQLTIFPNEIKTVSEEDGTYRMDVPEGNYRTMTVKADGYVPEHQWMNKMIEGGQSINQDIFLKVPKGAASGNMRIKYGDSYHFLEGKSYYLEGGDFIFGSDEGHPSFNANNAYMGGVLDLGDIGNLPLEQVKPPKEGYALFTRAVVGHTYVSLAKEGEEGHYIIFRVIEVKNEEYIEIEFYYR